MAYLLRLIFCGLLLFGSSAQAVETCTSANYPFTPRQTAMGLQYGTWVCGYGGRPPLNCGYTYLNWANSSVVTVYEGMCTMQAAPPQCEGGRERDASGQCVCKAGTFEPPSGVGACLATDPRNADRDACASFGAVNTLPGGALVQDYRLSGKVSAGTQFCMPGAFDNADRGCKVTFTPNPYIPWIDYGGGKVISEGTFSMAEDSNLVDQSCNVGEVTTPPKVPPVEKCKTGYTGTVNGVEVCVNKVPENGVGGTTETTEETKDNETKKVTKDTQTECNNGVCTTTTTTTTTTTNNTTGTVTTTTGTATTTKPQAGFCSENPSSKLCGSGDEKGSSFGGTCSAGFTCEGDAIQCAMAQEQHRRACKLFDDQAPESELYNAEKSKTGKRTGDLPGNETIAFGSSMYDASNALGPGTCISDLPADVLGQTVSLPISQICPHLATLRLALLAFGALLWVLIVFRG